MNFPALHQAIRRRLRSDETLISELRENEADSLLSPDEESALALLWQRLGQVGGDINTLIARVDVFEWTVPRGHEAEH